MLPLSNAVICLLVALGPFIEHQSSKPDANAAGLDCIVSMELPQYAALGVPMTGDVNTTITVGKDGRAADVNFSDAPQGMWRQVQGLVAYSLRERSTYDPACVGKKIQLLFTYRREGQPTAEPFAITRFTPPNRFTFVTQPRLPNVDRLGKEPSEGPVH